MLAQGLFDELVAGKGAMFDFAHMRDRAVILAGGEPFAAAKGNMPEVVVPL